MNQKEKSGLSPMGIIKRKAESLISKFVDLKVGQALVHWEEDKALRRQEGAINQEVCDKFFKCPDCLLEGSLKYNKDSISCRECGFTAEINYGIPCLIKKEDLGMSCQKFLRHTHDDVGGKIHSPHISWKHSWIRRFLGQEIFHFMNLVFFFVQIWAKKYF